MLFKGTKKRRNTLKISEELDKIGGSYNAFTGKEYTGYWAKVRREHLDTALDWVSDIFLNSKIEKKEVNRERGVIIEEYNMYLDTPSAWIDDLFEELFYGDQPAGWKVIGEKENIMKLTRENIVQYLKSHYSALNTIVSVSGNYEPKTLAGKIEEYFKKISRVSPAEKIRVKEGESGPKTVVHFKNTDQTHLCLGARAVSVLDPRHYVQEILSVILGGNMSSRLFIKVRERAGLAYYIRTSAEAYTDTGYLATFAGVPHKDAKRAIKMIFDEYNEIKRTKISKRELAKAKDYIKGSMVLSLEESHAKASFFAMQELLTGKIMTLEEKFEIIDRITTADVLSAAKEFFQRERIGLALIGPHKQENNFREIL